MFTNITNVMDISEVQWRAQSIATEFPVPLWDSNGMLSPKLRLQEIEEPKKNWPRLLTQDEALAFGRVESTS